MNIPTYIIRGNGNAVFIGSYVWTDTITGRPCYRMDGATVIATKAEIRNGTNDWNRARWIKEEMTHAYQKR